jgi:lactoylglutathione lyase
MRLALLGVALAAACAAAPAAAQQTQGAAVTLDHVAIFVADQPRSVTFYTELFGLKEIPSPFPPGGPRWFLFANGIEFHIQPGRKEPLALPRRVHFAVTVQSLDPVIAWLKAHGMTWVDSSDRVGQIARTRTDGVQQIFLQDPDGHWIEVNDVAKR